MDYKEKLTVASSFGVFVASCFLFGYWGAFNINILELGSISDLAKLAFFPLLTSLVFFLAGTLVTDVLHSHRFPAGGGNTTPVGKFGIKHWRKFVALIITSAAFVAILAPEPYKWVVFALLVSLLSTPLSHADAIIERIPDPQLRAKLLYLALLLPAVAFGYGRIDAYLVKKGLAPRTVDIVRSKLALKETATRPVAYLGYAGGLNILYESLSGQVVFVKQKDENPLFIVPHYETTILGGPSESDATQPPKPASPASGPSSPNKSASSN